MLSKNKINRLKISVVAIFVCVLAAIFWQTGTLAEKNDEKNQKTPLQKLKL